MGIDLQVRRFIVVAGHVHIDNPLGRQRSQVLAGVVAVVDRIDEEVVDVQQQVAIGLLQYRAQEVDLVQRLIRRGVVGNVFHRDTPLQNILCLADARGDMANRFVGKGQRQQVVQLAIVRAIAQVLAEERHVVPVEELAGTPQQLKIQRRRATKGQRKTVARQRKTLG
ncbi:hypothetical protein D3C77_212890 [compost metagenome]